MKTLDVVVDGKEIVVQAQKIGNQVWFHFDGSTYSHTPRSSQAQSSSQTGAQDPHKIIAPMPGKIIKVFVNVGDIVKEGQTLVAMEAMKMEYNLKATQRLQVRSIHCEKDGQVGLGDLLVQLEDCDG